MSKTTYEVTIITPAEREGGKDNFWTLGKVWQNDRGGYSGVSLFGRIIIKAVESRGGSGSGGAPVASPSGYPRQSAAKGEPFDGTIPF